MQKKNDLAEYLPDGAIDYVFPFLDSNCVHLKITPQRLTKQGDYRPPIRYPTHRISVNGSLNPYAFLITLVHEMAHLEVWKKQKSIREPHGNQWKTAFVAMMTPLLENDIFPPDLKQILQHHLKNPKAASALDQKLTIALQRYDKRKSTLLHALPENTLFAIKGRVFKKQHKARTHYYCQCLNNGRMYRINGIAEVVPMPA
ncbi:MAG: SprT-like domain-containing protein [Bacteroidales bacterium]|nr:SprT-like domain-containing protein [Bacteroidales bacterium]